MKSRIAAGHPISTGLDLIEMYAAEWMNGCNVALLSNPASVDSNFEPATIKFKRMAAEGSFALKALFGPQHGFYGDTQENMIEWFDFVDPETELPIYSLYGKTRKPTKEMLDDIDLFVCDLPDIGSRYYTYIWTMALCMEVCGELGIKVLVLDRPNPLGGLLIDGPPLEPGFESFVGLHAMPVVHGLTIGEVARYLNERYFKNCDLEVLKMDGWERWMLFPDTGLTWVPPSPNMPSFETALVYPGQCLLEGTGLSEGRGTTLPFRICGAPYINASILVEDLKLSSAQNHLPGAAFRPVHFRPTFHKHTNTLCGGVEIHVTEHESFRAFPVTIAILQSVFKRTPHHFTWKSPPYEYEHEKLPFDILSGSSKLRSQIENNVPLDDIFSDWALCHQDFSKEREPFLLYQ